MNPQFDFVKGHPTKLGLYVVTYNTKDTKEGTATKILNYIDTLYPSGEMMFEQMGTIEAVILNKEDILSYATVTIPN